LGLRWALWFAVALGIVAPAVLGLDAPAQPAAVAPSGGGSGGVVPAARQADHVVVVPIQGRLDRFQTASVMRRLAQAKAAGADAVVLELDSRQSNYGTVSELLSVIRQSPVANIVAWVHDAEGARSGGSAIRGGAGLVALACREIVVGGNASIGELIDPEWLNNTRSRRGMRSSPSPVVGPSGGIDRFADVAAPAISSAIESARRRGWDEYLVQAMAVPGVELWLVENIATGERLCINEYEHAMLFPTPPGRGNVELSSSKAATQFEAAMARVSATGGAGSAPWRGSGASVGGIAPIPASAGVAALLATQPVSTVESPSVRPVFTAADAGKWRVELYASDGAGSVTLQGKQLAKFGFAKATVNDEQELSAYFGAKKLTRLDQSWAEHVARFLSNPFVRGLLISIFMIAMFIEMTHPGMVVPGLIAATALALVLGPNFMMGLANWWSLGAVGVGIVLLALELFVIPGFGIAGIFGLITLFIGLVFTFVPGGPGGMAFSTPEAQDSLARGAVTVLLSTLTAMFGIFFVIRQLGTLPIMKRYTLQSPAPGEVDEALFGAIRPQEEPLLPGDIGVTCTLLRPAGKATFGEEVFDVVAQSGFIPEGVRVCVVSADRFRVVVEIADASGTGSGSGLGESSTTA
jgi:membrane-bound serine protease (ClpP class)